MWEERWHPLREEWVIIAAHRNNRPWSGRESWINLGMGFIALNIVTRYFLLFGSMLDGGVFFIVTGLLVLGLGWYLERKRRTLVGTVRKEATS